jgi:hypothetical protein
MIGRFIFLCDTEHFDVAFDAAKYLLENPEHKDAVTSHRSGVRDVAMYAKRLKKSISVRQVRP